MAQQSEPAPETQREYRSSSLPATSHLRIERLHLSDIDRTESIDSAYFDEVFSTSNTPSFVPAENSVQSRCDSGVDSQGRQSSSTSSDARLSVQSWHGSMSFSTKKVTAEEKTEKPARKHKNFERISHFFGKNMPFNSSFEKSPSTSSTFSETSSLKKTVLHKGGSTLHRVSEETHKQESEENSNKLEASQEVVDTTTMLEALQQLQEKTASGRTFAKAGSQITFGTCAVGFFNNEGGRLTLPTHGVSLYIPHNALETKEPQLVYIYAIPSSRKEPGLKVNETWLSPTVECGPSGLTFAKDVFLSIPHSATNQSQWTVNVHRGEENSVEWKKLEEGKDAIVFVGERKVTLAINHFSPYKISGRSSEVVDSLSSKWMKAAVFSDNYTTTGNETVACFHVRLCNSQDWKRVLQDEGIDFEDEKKIPSVSIPVADNGDDLVLHLKDINPVWNVLGEIQMHINFESVWSGYQHALDSGQLSIPIQMKTTSLIPESLEQEELNLCRIEVVQLEDMVAELTIKMTREFLSGRGRQPMARRTADEICQEMEDRFLAQQSDLNPDPHNLQYLSDTRYRRICSALDGANDIQSGWNAFAAFIGVNDVLIRASIETRARCQQRSPSVIVLDFFFSDSHDMDILDTLRMLSNIFLDINNYSAKVVVDEEIREKITHLQDCYGKDTTLTTDEMNGACPEKCQDQQRKSSLQEMTDTDTGEKAKHKRLNWLQSVKGFISKPFKSKEDKKSRRKSKEAEATHRHDELSSTKDTDTDLSESNGGSTLGSTVSHNHAQDRTTNPLPMANRVDSCPPKENISKQMSFQKSISVGSVLSSTSVFEADVLTDTNDQMLKPIRRQATCDSGVYSQRGSSRTSSSSFLHDYNGVN